MSLFVYVQAGQVCKHLAYQSAVLTHLQLILTNCHSHHLQLKDQCLPPLFSFVVHPLVINCLASSLSCAPLSAIAPWPILPYPACFHHFPLVPSLCFCLLLHVLRSPSLPSSAFPFLIYFGFSLPCPRLCVCLWGIICSCPHCNSAPGI